MSMIPVQTAVDHTKEHEVDQYTVSALQEASIAVPSNLKFLNVNWFLACGEKERLQDTAKTPVSFLSLTDDVGKIRGACPYTTSMYHGLKAFSLTGYNYPFKSIIVDENHIEECTKSLISKIHNGELFDVVILEILEEESEVTKNIEESFRVKKWKSHKVDVGQQYAVMLPESMDDYKNALSKKMLGNIRREKNKLHKLGEVKDVKYNDLSQHEWSKIIDNCAEVERNSWANKSDIGKTELYGHEKFWKQLLNNEETSSRVNVWLTYLDEKPISYNLAIDSGEYRYGISAHYNEDYKTLGVGGSMHMCVIEDAIDKGLKKLNMGYGFGEYKQRWNAEPISALTNYIYFRPSFMGKLVYDACSLKKFADNYLPKSSRKISKTNDK